MMPIMQRCPVCHDLFEGTDCIGGPCLSCELRLIGVADELGLADVPVDDASRE